MIRLRRHTRTVDRDESAKRPDPTDLRRRVTSMIGLPSTTSYALRPEGF